MLGAGVDLPGGRTLRPVRASDGAFLAALYRSTRSDLFLIGDRDLSESLVDMQFTAQSAGYGERYPDALHFIIGELDTSIGRLILDFSDGSVHLVDLSLIPEARGKGHGAAVIQAMQQVAARMPAPLTLAVQQANSGAFALYQRLGFHTEQQSGPYLRMAWYPRALASGAAVAGERA